MMTKQEWLDYQLEHFKDADRNVLEFIANIRFHSGKDEDVTYNLFSNGYCYYFAKMLQDAFNRGRIYWVEKRGHIVWLDDNGIVYDISGVYTDYYRLQPISYLGGTIVDFMHNGKEYSFGKHDFSDWCTHYKVSEIYAITDIYMRIPQEEIRNIYDVNPFFNTIEKVAFDYWLKNLRELSEIYAEEKHRKNHI